MEEGEQRRYKKGALKTSLPQMKEKSSKSKNVRKLSNKYKKGCEEFDDMDSLTFLKDVTERKKMNRIDERIKLLKIELKSLFDDKKSNEDGSFFADQKSDTVCADLLNFDEISEAGTKILDSNCKKPSKKDSSIINNLDDFKYNTSPIPSKFSVWLDKTIDEMESKPEAEEKNLPRIHSTPLNSKLQVESTETSPSLASDFKSKFLNTSLLPQHQVEKLLYKSLVMQNSEVYLSSSEDSDKEHVKPISKLKQQKCRRSKKQCKKSHPERLVQSNLSNNCRFSQKGRKRRLINKNSFQNEVEVIDLDNSLGNKEMPKTNCEVLDVDSYDWNEPFDLDKDIEFPSDVEIRNNFKKNNVKLNDQDLKFNGTEIIESDQSICYIGENKAQQKKVWECPVCFEQSKGQEVVATQCGHIFCKNCIENHSSKLGKNCPSCRSDLKDKPLITLFNF